MRRFRFDIRKNLFMEKVAGCQNGLPREAVESLEVFETWVSDGTQKVRLVVGLGDHERLFQPR